MCGISGIFSNQELINDFLKESVDCISHRGPDEIGYFYSPNCQLGICRLAIIDVTRGQQPSYDNEKYIVSVFNGEIYNYRELSEQLRKRGHVIPTPGDSAIIPFLYKEFGEKFPQKIQGMFAIAIYDKLQNKLILSRDRLGKKPLWYTIQQHQLFFSSEIKGLLGFGVQANFDDTTLCEFLTFGYINAPRSPFKGVQQLPPASTLIYEEGRSKTETYWSSSDVPELDISFDEAKNETKRLLMLATEARMISERPIGAFLSGGIDSTIVTALMSQISHNPINTYCIGFADTKYDESDYASNVARYLGTNHHTRFVEADPMFLVKQLAKTLDQPFADSSIVPTLQLSQFAREDVVVALSGDGGDEAFAGYERYRAGKWLDDRNLLLYLNPITLYPSRRIENLKLRKLVKHSQAQPLVNRYLAFQSLFQPSDLKRMLNPDLLETSWRDTFEGLWESIPSEDKIRKMQEVDIRTYLPGDLMYKVDISSMANGLEVRSPFLDYRVIEFGLSLPWKYKIGNGENKHILREIARELVPGELINRPKKGFGIPRGRWLRNELQNSVREVLLDRDSASRGWFKQQELEKIIEMHQQGQELDHLIWPVFTLQLWAKYWLK